MNSGAEPARDSGGRHGLGETGALAFLLLSYLVILSLLQRWPEPSGNWARLSVPSLWLLAACVALALFRPPAWSFLAARGGGAWIQAAVVLAAVAGWAGIAAASAEGGFAGGLDRAETPRFLLLALLVPVAEEAYFRGFLLHALRRPFGRVGALVLSTALFAFLHFPQGNALTMAALGLAAGAAALLTGSLLGAVAIHMAWNAASLRVESGTIPHSPVLDVAALFLLFSIGAWSLWRGLRKHDERTGSPAREEAGPA